MSISYKPFLQAELAHQQGAGALTLQAVSWAVKQGIPVIGLDKDVVAARGFTVSNEPRWKPPPLWHSRQAVLSGTKESQAAFHPLYGDVREGPVRLPDDFFECASASGQASPAAPIIITSDHSLIQQVFASLRASPLESLLASGEFTDLETTLGDDNTRLYEHRSGLRLVRIQFQSDKGPSVVRALHRPGDDGVRDSSALIPTWVESDEYYWEVFLKPTEIREPDHEDLEAALRGFQDLEDIEEASSIPWYENKELRAIYTKIREAAMDAYLRGFENGHLHNLNILVNPRTGQVVLRDWKLAGFISEDDVRSGRRLDNFDWADLSGLDLSFDLQDVGRTYCHFVGSQFGSTYSLIDFARSDFSDTDLSGGTFKDCGFRDVLFHNTVIGDATFEKTDLRGARLEGAQSWDLARFNDVVVTTDQKDFLLARRPYLETVEAESKDGKTVWHVSSPSFSTFELHNIADEAFDELLEFLGDKSVYIAGHDPDQYLRTFMSLVDNLLVENVNIIDISNLAAIIDDLKQLRDRILELDLWIRVELQETTDFISQTVKKLEMVQHLL